MSKEVCLKPMSSDEAPIKHSFALFLTNIYTKLVKQVALAPHTFGYLFMSRGAEVVVVGVGRKV